MVTRDEANTNRALQSLPLWLEDIHNVLVQIEKRLAELVKVLKEREQ